jgi:hypothetical protein
VYFHLESDVLDNGASFDVAKRFEAINDCREIWLVVRRICSVPKITNFWNFMELLGVCGKRPRCHRTAQNAEKIASLHAGPFVLDEPSYGSNERFDRGDQPQNYCRSVKLMSLLGQS